MNNTVFLETIRVENGIVSHIEYHQQRLDRTLAAHDIDKAYTLSSLIQPPAQGLYRCRILYSEERIEISYHPYALRTFSSLQAVFDDAITYEYKYAERSALNRLFEFRAACDDIVIVKNGLLTDTTIANIALFDGRRWVTPSKPLLYGTTRARLIDEGKLEEAEIPLSHIDQYRKVAIMNAMVGFVEVENGIILPK